MAKRWDGLGRMRARVAAAVIAGGLVSLGLATATSAAATLTATPSTGLTNGQSVSLSGTGFTPTSIGNVLECNNDPKEPTVALGGVINSSIAVGCNAPSLSKLVTTSASGTVSTTWKVIAGTVGPPCGPAPAAATCPATDSAGKDPVADAANYPCPPTAAQQAAGDSCTLTYGDQARDSAVATIQFQSAPTGTTTPSATSAPTGNTSAPAGATSNTSAGAGVGSGAGASSDAAAGASSAAPTTAAAAAPGTVAMTGPGPHLYWVLGTGLILTVVGAVLWLGQPLRWRRRPSTVSRTARDSP